MTGHTDPARAAEELGPDMVVMKMGAGGVRAWNGREVHVPALKVKCRDSTGAGCLQRRLPLRMDEGPWP